MWYADDFAYHLQIQSAIWQIEFVVGENNPNPEDWNMPASWANPTPLLQ